MTAFSLIIYSFFIIVLSGSEAKEHTTTVSSFTSGTNQTEMNPTEKTEEPVGDRWDDEDWGSLEVNDLLSVLHKLLVF